MKDGTGRRITPAEVLAGVIDDPGGRWIGSPDPNYIRTYMYTTLRLLMAGTALTLVSSLPSPEAALSDEDLAVRIVCAEALRAPRTERRAIFGVVLERARRGGWRAGRWRRRH